MSRMPPMPEPRGHVAKKLSEGRVVFMPRPSLDPEGMVGIYTADQIRERDRLIVEACIAALDDLRPKNERSDWTRYAEDRNDLLNDAAAALRSLLEQGGEE